MVRKQLFSSQKVFDFLGTLFSKGFWLIALGLFLWLLLTLSPQAAVGAEKGVSKLKDLYLKTTLVENGQPKASIFIPKEKGYEPLGKAIQDKIQKKSGVTLPVVKEIAALQGNIIALGKMTNNKIIERLYWNHYTLVDSIYPGKEGYIIQTVHNPYPFPEGTNVIILG